MSGWIGVDLDSTLAVYTGWNGPCRDFNHIGKPIPEMWQRVNDWMDKGIEVRIFTARASVPEYIPPIRAWLEEHFGERAALIGITNVKDFGMIEVWDDRCIRVIPNTGRPCCAIDLD